MLIPGLLVMLLVVVLVSAVVKRADGAPDATPYTVVSTLGDERITESSGLAVSSVHPGIAYTVNDSGNAPVVFAIDISTGETVGVTTLSVELRDAEALAVDGGGQVWVADIGNNLGTRETVALYSFDEPGRASATVRPTRWPVAFADGPHDAEALLIDPTSGDKFLITKSIVGGKLYALPDELSIDEVNVAEVASSAVLPAFVTDASFEPDGSGYLVRNYVSVERRELDSETPLWTATVPDQKQGETVAYEVGGATFLLGSEGARSTLLRVAVSDVAGEGVASKSVSGDEVDGEGAAASQSDKRLTRTGDRGWLVAGGVILAAIIGAAVLLARPRSR